MLFTAREHSAIASFRAQLLVYFFMEMIILMLWSIWTVGNEFIFKQEPFNAWFLRQQATAHHFEVTEVTHINKNIRNFKAAAWKGEKKGNNQRKEEGSTQSNNWAGPSSLASPISPLV